MLSTNDEAVFKSAQYLDIRLPLFPSYFCWVLGVLLLDKKEHKIAWVFRYFRQTMGNTPGNFECYLAFRGLLSLQCRMERQAASARYLGRFVATTGSVSR